MKYSFLATFKNRDEKRIRLFLDSLHQQNIQDFELIFVNQGSEESVNNWIQEVVKHYSFIRYIHNRTEGYLWNKGNALNIGIKEAKGEYVIVADIDLIFRPNYLNLIDSMITPGIFITHHIYYIHEAFQLKHVKDVTENNRNDEFTEAFHSACVASRAALTQIKGYDEFYMVWGVEDDDIIRSLRNAGQVHKKTTANEINIYHQWHPSVGFAKPSAWYLTMVNHLLTQKRDQHFGMNWGKVYLEPDRPILKIIEDKSYAKANQLSFFEGRDLLFFNTVIEGFHKLRSGEVAFLAYETTKPRKDIKSFFSRRKKTLSEDSIITNTDIVEFFYFFIGCQRQLIADYYYKAENSKFLFVCIKL